MPGKTKIETPEETKEAAAAAVEVVDPKTDIMFEFGGHMYRFKRKRLQATQFRLPMQKGFNEVAVEFLLGTEFQLFLARNLDEDGCTPADVFYDFVNTLGQELGTGNS